MRIALGANQELDVERFKAAITDQTVLLVGSAPSLTLGMVDPIAELALVAEERQIGFHVDACVGGWFLPWAERLGNPVPLWDFRCRA